jgi:hypothetical protein
LGVQRAVGARDQLVDALPDHHQRDADAQRGVAQGDPEPAVNGRCIGDPRGHVDIDDAEGGEEAVTHAWAWVTGLMWASTQWYSPQRASVPP